MYPMEKSMQWEKSLAIFTGKCKRCSGCDTWYQNKG